MKKHHRDSQGRAIKFAEISRVVAVAAKRAYAKAVIFQVVMQGLGRIQAIKSEKGDKLSKSMAIAKSAVETFSSASKAYNHAMHKSSHK